MVLKKEKFNFNRAYQDLQKIVEWFEQEDIDLEEGIKKFEEGSELTRQLKEYLQTMDNKIKELKKNLQ